MKEQKKIIRFSKEEQTLFQIIKKSLFAAEAEDALIELQDEEWETVCLCAQKHGVLSLLDSDWNEKKFIPEKVKEKISIAAKKTVLQQYRLLFLSRYLIHVLEENDIRAVILKGVTAGEYYPVPELRKSGDIDLLLLNPADLESATKLFQREGFCVKKEQLALHHVSITTSESIEIELHTMLAEPFDNEKTNLCLRRFLSEAAQKVERKEIMGLELPVLRREYYAFELLVHMLQHFLRSGFGLRLLCDWVMFWQKPLGEQEARTYLRLVEEIGIRGFSDMVTMTCVKFLGLSKELILGMNIQDKYSVEEFMREILDAEEFGKSGKNRTVVMRGTGITDYCREFHHQMRLNFPKAGKCIVLWPVLWIVTLVRFLRNNKKIRKIPTTEILKEANRRSQFMKEIGLFR